MAEPELPRNPKAKGRAPAKSTKMTPRPAVAEAKKAGLIIATSPPATPSEDLNRLIAKRAYELYVERGYRHGYATEDWLDAEREVLSRMPPA
jgi:hypothetical protein